MSKVVVIGLDGLIPELVELWADELPNIKRFESEGIWGKMKSTIPPNSLLAWACAQTGRNPGFLGFWDNNYRDDFSYGLPKQVNSQVYGKPTEVNFRRSDGDPLFRLLFKRGLKVAIINVPGSWPPPRITGGYCVSGSMVSDLDRGYTWPDSLKHEIQNLIGEYIIDVPKLDTSYRELDKDAASKRIREMDEQRFKILRHFIFNKKCDYIFTVIEGPNKMAHLFYRYFDKKHKRFEPNSKYADFLIDYYRFIDKEIGKVRDSLDNETVLLVHSEHGMQRLNGRINLNEWLINEGYLFVEKYPSKPSVLKNLKIGWSKTKAWAMGQMGQIYLNVKGRETEGIVDGSKYDSLLDELIEKLKGITDENGNPLKVAVFKPSQVHFGPLAKYGPDLFVCFEDYHWDTNEMVGYNGNHISDSPYDDATKGLYGYFCVVGPNVQDEGEKKGITILDVAPTVLSIMEQEIPKYMEGKPFIKLKLKKEKEVEKTMQKRLELLGY